MLAVNLRLNMPQNEWKWETAHLTPGAGIVVVRMFDDGWRYLGLRNKRGLDISKGHVEDGEDFFDTAIRETEEESGIKELNFKWGKNYINLDFLRVYVAETKEDASPVINKKSMIYEHDSAEWLTYEEIREQALEYLVPAIEWARDRIMP